MERFSVTQCNDYLWFQLDVSICMVSIGLNFELKTMSVGILSHPFYSTNFVPLTRQEPS